MNLQSILKNVLPDNWLDGANTLPSFAIDDEFQAKEKKFKKECKETQNKQDKKENQLKQEKLAAQKQEWLIYSQG